MKEKTSGTAYNSTVESHHLATTDCKVNNPEHSDLSLSCRLHCKGSYRHILQVIKLESHSLHYKVTEVYAFVYLQELWNTSSLWKIEEIYTGQYNLVATSQTWENGSNMKHTCHGHCNYLLFKCFGFKWYHPKCNVAS